MSLATARAVQQRGFVVFVFGGYAGYVDQDVVCVQADQADALECCAPALYLIGHLP
jgi:hypothetical protein